MKNIIKIIVAAGVICLAASCEKAPKGPTDLSGGCEAVDENSTFQKQLI